MLTSISKCYCLFGGVTFEWEVGEALFMLKFHGTVLLEALKEVFVTRDYISRDGEHSGSLV